MGALVAAAIAAGLPAPAAGASLEGSADEVIVRFRDGTAAADRKEVRAEAGTELERTLSLPGLQLVDPEPGVSLAEAVRRLESSDEVLYAEPDVIRTATRRPSDPLFSQQWSLDTIRMRSAWDRTVGSPSITVGVIDTGVDAGHPDLSANIARNAGESGGGRETNGRDDDRNGLVDDWHGWDWVEGDNNPADTNGHGTQVAGIAAARGGDGHGMAGVAWQVKVLPLRVLDESANGHISDVVEAYDYAAARGLPIVNASLAGSTFSQAEYDAIAAASSTLFIVAAGNEGRDNDRVGSYPCNHQLPNLVCVTATDRSDALAGFANYGRRAVDLAAPGVDILGTAPGGRWGFMSGTSAAAPHVAGAAALIASRWPGTPPDSLRAALLASADPVPSLAGATLTGARLNANRALTASPSEWKFARKQGADPARSPASGPAPPPPTGPATGDATPPSLRAVVHRRLSLRAVLRRGLRVRARCSEACSLRLRLTVPRASAAELVVVSPTIVLGHASTRIGRAGSRVVRVRIPARSRRLLSRARKPNLVLTVRGTDDSGNRATVSRSLRLRG